MTHLNKLRYMPGRTRTWEEECESQARVIEAWEAAAQENAPEPPTFEQAMQVASRKIAGLTEEVEQLRAELGGQCECCGRPTAGRFCGGCAD